MNGHPFRANLVPTGAGRYRLYINGDMRNRARVDVGDRATLILEPDPEPRTIPMPEAFARALVEHPKARAEFERLSPSRQKEILVYLNWLKRPETLQRNIEKTIRKLEDPGIHS